MVPHSAITIRSTDVDRCLQSVHSLLDALYPGSMLPVHTIPEHQEKLLQPTDKCPSYLVAYRTVLAELDEVVMRELTALPPPPAAAGLPPARAFNLLAYMAKTSGWGQKLLPANLVTIVTDNLMCLRAHALPVPPLLQTALPLLRNYTSQIYFHKFSPMHIRRAWDRAQGHSYTLADEEVDSSDPLALDPRGSVGGLLTKHLVHHWENKIKAIQLEEEVAGANAPDPAVDAFLEIQSILGAGVDGSSDDLSEEQFESEDASAASSSAFLELDATTEAPPPTVSRHGRLPFARKAPSTEQPPVASTEDDADSRWAPPDPSAAPHSGSALKPRPRSRYKNHAGAARVIGEKLMLYSAHDSTIIALMTSLGLITSPHSEYLLPPYAASVTLELRHNPSAAHAASSPASADSAHTSPLEGYYVNAFFGFPVPLEGSAPAGVPAEERWEYHRHPIALRCPEVTASATHDATSERPVWKARKAWQCPLESFRHYVLLTAKSGAITESSLSADNAAATQIPDTVGTLAYAPDDGCCVRTASFHSLGCDAPDVAGMSVVDELDAECVAWRERCPSTACSRGFSIDPISFACIPTTPLSAEAIEAAAAESAASKREDLERPNDLTIPVSVLDPPDTDSSLAASSPAAAAATSAPLPPHAFSHNGLSLDTSTNLPARSPLEWWLVLFGCVCLLAGFAMGVCFTRPSSGPLRLPFGGRKEFYADYSLNAGDRSGPSASVNEDDDRDRESLLGGGGGINGSGGGKRRYSPNDRESSQQDALA